VAEAEISQPGRLVIKVGGSLVETGRLNEVLARIADARRPVIVVPGGGSFADKVRDLQNALRFDDASAHRLAILGMHQMAEVYFKLERRLAPADSLTGIARILATGLIPVWMPLHMVQQDETIPRDWTITSDGLAARLAQRLGSAGVVLLKSCEVDPKASLEDLAQEGIVDPVFPKIIARAGLKWRVLGPHDDQELHGLLDGREIGHSQGI
jgi:aspartokinase-like uncharacterized kinase